VPAHLISHEGRHLCQCEHEDQVEEQLKRGNRGVLLLFAKERTTCLHWNILLRLCALSLSKSCSTDVKPD
jgi:hypothetical protein